MTATRKERPARRDARLAERRARGRRPGGLPVVPLLAAGLGVIVVGYVALTWWSSPKAQLAPFAAQPRGFSPLAAQPGGFSPPAPGNVAPDFTVDTFEHGPFTLSAQRGKPTVMFFTASYCEPCIPQMRTLARVQEEIGADQLGVLVLDVDFTEGIEGLRRLKLRTGGSYPFALDAGNRVTLLYGVRALDTKMFIDRSGLLVDRVDGIAESDRQLRNRVEALIRGT